MSVFYLWCIDKFVNMTNVFIVQLADYMSGDFLLEQYQGMRDLAGKLSTLNKLDKSEIGLFIIDKKLLNGEVL